MDIEEGLVIFLKLSEELHSLVGDRIYPMVIPQNVVTPCLTYQLVSDAPEMSHSGNANLQRVRFQFRIWGNGYAQAKHVAKVLKNTLHGKSVSMGDFKATGIKVINVFDDIQETVGLFTPLLEITFWYGG